MKVRIKLVHFFFTFIFPLALFFVINAQTAVIENTQLLHFANDKLITHGVLKRADNGLIYVDVDDNYIHLLKTLIKEPGFEAPPYFGQLGLVGAHITVINSDEARKYHITEVSECESEVLFTLKECQIVQPASWEKMQFVYLIVIESDFLDQIRKKYHLPPKKYPFHITIAVKKY